MGPAGPGEHPRRGGRAYGEGKVFTEDGTLAASFSQEAIIRPFPEGHSPEGREATIL